MSGLVWNPAWYQQGESFWSVANKIAFASKAVVEDVAHVLTGEPAGDRPSIFLTCAMDTAINLCRRLGISVSSVAQLFVSTQALSLCDRQNLSIGLRWCPVCLQQGFHAVLFQDWRLSVCPWHRTALIEACPYCRLAVDPLGDQFAAWTCNCCAGPFFEPPVNWIRAFKTPVDFDWAPLVENALFGVSEVVNEAETSYYPQQCLTPVSERGRVLHPLVESVRWVYEDVRAICESVLIGHQGCLAFEGPVNFTNTPMKFTCPVAAAMACAAGWLDVATSGPNSYWSAGHRPPARGANHWLEYELGEMPFWARRFLVRENFRAWLVDATQTFLKAHRNGQTTETWYPKRFSGVKWKAVDNKIVMSPHCDWPGFSKLIEDYNKHSCCGSRFT